MDANDVFRLIQRPRLSPIHPPFSISPSPKHDHSRDAESVGSTSGGGGSARSPQDRVSDEVSWDVRADNVRLASYDPRVHRSRALTKTAFSTSNSSTASLRRPLRHTSDPTPLSLPHVTSASLPVCLLPEPRVVRLVRLTRTQTLAGPAPTSSHGLPAPWHRHPRPTARNPTKWAAC